jgi:hypothetical protein
VLAASTDSAMLASTATISARVAAEAGDTGRQDLIMA